MSALVKEKELLEQIENQNPQMLEGIKRIVSIPSEQSAALEQAPYGKEVRRALDETMALAKEMGFETEIVADQIGIVKLGQGEDYIGILGHLDVVPAIGDWTSDPYKPEVRNGKMYGRGVLDNKGPILTCLYALKAIKDLDLPLKHPIWILFGTNEETGMADIPEYLKHKKPPVAGWTPDCKFPVVYAERGRAVFEICFENKDAFLDWLNSYVINNMPMEKALKLDIADPEFGKLEIRNKKAENKKISFALSYPPSTDCDFLKETIEKTLSSKDHLHILSDWKPVFFKKDGVLCKILQSAYEELTGLDGTPVTTTGGTYAKRMPNILPFGPSFPGQKGIAHLPDEWMNLEDLNSMAKIYGLAMYRLGNEEL